MTSFLELMQEHHPEADVAFPLEDVQNKIANFVDVESFLHEGTDIGFISTLMLIQSLRHHHRFSSLFGVPDQAETNLIVVASAQGVGVLVLHAFAGTGWSNGILSAEDFSPVMEDSRAYTPARAPWIWASQRPRSDAWSMVDPSSFENGLRQIAESLVVPFITAPRPRWKPLNIVDPPESVRDRSNTLLGSLGVAGTFGSQDVYTTAFHCVDGFTSLSIKGHPTQVVHQAQSVDLAALDAGGANLHTRSITAVRTDAPGLHNPMTFYGAETGNKEETIITGVDPGVSTHVSHTTHVYTDPDPTDGDSGCALLDDNDRLVGFCREETGGTSGFHAASWVWSDQALSVAGVVV